MQQLLAQGIQQAMGQHHDTVLVALCLPHHDHFAVKVHILDA
jgi:hypothetical protein